MNVCVCALKQGLSFTPVSSRWGCCVVHEFLSPISFILRQHSRAPVFFFECVHCSVSIFALRTLCECVFKCVCVLLLLQCIAQTRICRGHPMEHVSTTFYIFSCLVSVPPLQSVEARKNDRTDTSRGETKLVS